MPGDCFANRDRIRRSFSALRRWWPITSRKPDGIRRKRTAGCRAVFSKSVFRSAACAKFSSGFSATVPKWRFFSRRNSAKWFVNMPGGCLIIIDEVTAVRQISRAGILTGCPPAFVFSVSCSYSNGFGESSLTITGDQNFAKFRKFPHFLIDNRYYKV